MKKQTLFTFSSNISNKLLENNLSSFKSILNEQKEAIY